MKTVLKTFLMLAVLIFGILYVDYTVNSLLGNPKVVVIDYAKEQIYSVWKNIIK